MKKYPRLILLFLIILISFQCQVTESDNDQQEPLQPSQLIQPEDLIYRGAFHLPDAASASVTKSWEWGGYALTSRSNGDPHGKDDDYPGSLFTTGHAWEHQISEISIPRPVISNSKNLGDLNIAQTIQPFRDIFNVGHLEIPRVTELPRRRVAGYHESL